MTGLEKFILRASLKDDKTRSSDPPPGYESRLDREYRPKHAGRPADEKGCQSRPSGGPPDVRSPDGPA